MESHTWYDLINVYQSFTGKYYFFESFPKNEFLNNVLIALFSFILFSFDRDIISTHVFFKFINESFIYCFLENVLIIREVIADVFVPAKYEFQSLYSENLEIIWFSIRLKNIFAYPIKCLHISLENFFLVDLAILIIFYHICNNSFFQK